MMTYTLLTLYVKYGFDVYVKLDTVYVIALRQIFAPYVIALYELRSTLKIHTLRNLPLRRKYWPSTLHKFTVYVVKVTSTLRAST